MFTSVCRAILALLAAALVAGCGRPDPASGGGAPGLAASAAQPKGAAGAFPFPPTDLSPTSLDDPRCFPLVQVCQREDALRFVAWLHKTAGEQRRLASEDPKRSCKPSRLRTASHPSLCFIEWDGEWGNLTHAMTQDFSLSDPDALQIYALGTGTRISGLDCSSLGMTGVGRRKVQGTYTCFSEDTCQGPSARATIQHDCLSPLVHITITSATYAAWQPPSGETPRTAGSPTVSPR